MEVFGFKYLDPQAASAQAKLGDLKKDMLQYFVGIEDDVLLNGQIVLISLCVYLLAN